MKIMRLFLLICLLVGSLASYAQEEVNIYNAESIQKYLKERISETKARQKEARDALKSVDKEMRTLQRDLEKSRAQAIKDRQRLKAAQKSGKFYQPKPYVPAELKNQNVENAQPNMSKEERAKLEAEQKQKVQAAKTEAKQKAEKAEKAAEDAVATVLSAETEKEAQKALTLADVDAEKDAEEKEKVEVERGIRAWLGRRMANHRARKAKRQQAREAAGKTEVEYKAPQKLEELPFNMSTR